MELGTEVRWQERIFKLPMERILLSEELGYDAVFTAEGYGSDALTPLGYLACATKRLKLGQRILEVTGRPPAVTAMSLQTLNHLTGGNRIIAGVGTAALQAREGFQGLPWGKPVRRMRDFVTILRQGLEGQPLDHDGQEWCAPYRGPGAHGLPPAPLGLAPMGEIPVCIAASGPQMIALAAEIGDGWMPPGWHIGDYQMFRPLLDQGFARRPGGEPKDYKIWAHVDMLVDDDVRAAMRPFKEYVVTWSAIHREFMIARGFKDVADRLAELVAQDPGADPEARLQAGEKFLRDPLWEEAIAAVPDEYIDNGWLVGPVARIEERARRWRDCGLTGMIVRYGDQLSHEPIVENLDAFRAVARAFGRA